MLQWDQTPLCALSTSLGCSGWHCESSLTKACLLSAAVNCQFDALVCPHFGGKIRLCVVSAPGLADRLSFGM